MEDTVYLHRLAIVRAKIGSGLGGKVLKLAEEICKEQGATFLRLDCVRNNKKLNQFYQHNHFHSVGSYNNHSRYESIKYK
ncbi:GNAT family N-acetyltransferase [Bacillus sp. JCM 19041]|uniref:GNAT family N-acetyltransferase n=1 Tax=Bacillus sp. JCM 19041 TaxID=1460637 RepID=UPI0006D1714C